MAARSKARKRALDLLFASEVRHRPATEALEEELAEAEHGGRPVADYTDRLVRGIVAKHDRIDQIITGYSRNWTLDRMPAVDRNVLRMAVYEILWVSEVPYAVTVSEALHLVRQLSTDESPSYVNGILGAVVRDQGSLVAG